MTVKIFFISDLHLSHKNLRKFREERSGVYFNNIEEMDDWLIDNINSVVRPKDHLWILGDVAWGSTGMNKVRRINGKKHLVLGNHDKYTINEISRDFASVHGVYKKYDIIMTHVPIHPLSLVFNWRYNMHGHIHHKERDIKDNKYINVNVDIIGPRPLQLEQIRGRMEENDRLESSIKNRTQDTKDNNSTGN